MCVDTNGNSNNSSANVNEQAASKQKETWTLCFIMLFSPISVSQQMANGFVLNNFLTMTTLLPSPVDRLKNKSTATHNIVAFITNLIVRLMSNHHTSSITLRTYDLLIKITWKDIDTLWAQHTSWVHRAQNASPSHSICVWTGVEWLWQKRN